VSIPTHLPGTVSKPRVSLEQRLADVEARLDELARKDLSNAVVGQGGRFRAVYNDGTESILIGLDPVSGKQKIRISDPAGNVLIESDTDAGWGFKRPIVNLPMNLQKPDSMVTTSNTFDLFYTSDFVIDHPKCKISSGLISFGLASCQASGYWTWSCNLDNVVHTLPTHVVSGANNSQYFADSFLLDEAMAGWSCQVNFFASMSGTVTGGNKCVPLTNYLALVGLHD
jgi:hypothetical protein